MPPPLQLGDVPVLAGHQDGAGTVRAPGGVNLIVGLGYKVREVVNETIKEPEDVVEACWAPLALPPCRSCSTTS